MGIGHELGSMIFNGIFFFLLLVQRPIFQFETRESLSRAKIATLRLTTRGYRSVETISPQINARLLSIVGLNDRTRDWFKSFIIYLVC